MTYGIVGVIVWLLIGTNGLGLWSIVSDKVKVWLNKALDKDTTTDELEGLYK